MMKCLQSKGNDVLLYVHLQPAAKVTAWAGKYNDRVKIRLAAPPVDGKANAALCTWLAQQLAYPARDVILVRGETSKQKTVCFQGALLHYNQIYSLLKGYLQKDQ